MRGKLKQELALAVAAVGCLIPIRWAAATNYYWDTDGTTTGAGAGNGTWTTGSNWNTDATGGAGGAFGTAPGPSDNATLSAGATTGAYAISLGGATVGVNALAFNTSNAATIGSTVGDGTITLGAGGLTATGTGNAALLTIKSNIELNGSQTWSTTNGGSPVGLAISGGIEGTGNLIVAQNSGRQSNIIGNVNFTGSLTLNGGGGGTVTISGNIGSNVTNLLANASTAPLILSGSNTYTGTTRIVGTNSGTETLKVGNNAALPSSTVVTLDSATNKSTAILDLGLLTNSFSPTVAGLFASATAGTGRQGRSIVTNSDTTAAFAHTGTLTVNPTSSDTFSGLIQDGASSRVALSVGGNSTFTLASANAYTGGTTVSSGTLAVNAAAGITTNITVSAVATGTTTQSATVSSSTGMAIGQAVSASNLSPGTTIIGINGTTIYLSASATATGTQSGTFTGWQSLGNGSVTASGSGVLDLSGSTTTSVSAVTVSGGTIQNGTITATSYSTTGGIISANLAGSASLTKTTGGTTTVSGANSYTAGTLISAGTLRAATSASPLGSGDVTVNGIGSAGSAVLELDVATSIANTATLVLTNGGVVSLKFGSGNTEDVAVLNLGGVIFNTNSIFSESNGFVVNGTSYASYFSGSDTGTSLRVIPEPSSTVVAGMGLGVFALRRRRSLLRRV